MAMTFSAAPNFPAKLAIGRATNPSNNALAMPPTKADIKANDRALFFFFQAEDGIRDSFR